MHSSRIYQPAKPTAPYNYPSKIKTAQLFLNLSATAFLSVLPQTRSPQSRRGTSFVGVQMAVAWRMHVLIPFSSRSQLANFKSKDLLQVKMSTASWDKRVALAAYGGSA
jgi:hypothetical protein